MIEFKRTGDVMVFECPAFKVEVVADAERISVNPGRLISGSGEMMALLTDAFQILDIMLEHKEHHTHILKADISICDEINWDIEALKLRAANSNNPHCAAGD